MFALRVVLFLFLAYLVGCAVGAYYIGRWRRGVDIRSSGSGNAGARNMARVHGLQDAALTLAFDAAKGALVTWLAYRLFQAEWIAAAAMLAVIVGHVWPAQLEFHGGKGAAAGLGAMLVLEPTGTLVLLGVAAIALLVSRRFTASGLIAIALTAPMLAWQGHGHLTVGIATAAALLCLVVQHPAFDKVRPAEPRTVTPS